MGVEVKGLAADPPVQSIAAGLPPRHSRARDRATAYHEAGHAIVAFVCGNPKAAMCNQLHEGRPLTSPTIPGRITK